MIVIFILPVSNNERYTVVNLQLCVLDKYAFKLNKILPASEKSSLTYKFSGFFLSFPELLWLFLTLSRKMSGL